MPIAGNDKASKVILLVDDDDRIRALARRILETSGYVVHEASNGRQGLELCEAHDGPIDLLVTDVEMPDLRGPDLAEHVLKLRPGLPVMFMSGYPLDIVREPDVRTRAAFLLKPFTPAGLRQTVLQSLEL